MPYYQAVQIERSFQEVVGRRGKTGMHAARCQGDLHVSVRLGLIVLQDVAFFHKGMKAKRIPKAQSLTAERKTPPCKGGVCEMMTHQSAKLTYC